MNAPADLIIINAIQQTYYAYRAEIELLSAGEPVVCAGKGASIAVKDEGAELISGEKAW